MSVGVLCIIVIPTKEEEFRLLHPNSDKSNGAAATLSLEAKDAANAKQQNGTANGHIHNTTQSINDNSQYDLNRVNTTPYSIDKNAKVPSGIDNRSFEIDIELNNANNLQNKRNKSSDDVKDASSSTKETSSTPTLSNKDDNSAYNSRRKLNISSTHLDIPTESSMTTILKEILKKLKVDNVSWSKIRDEKYYQVMFTMECDVKYENLQIMLSEWGIGERKGSSVSFATCTFNSYRNEYDDRKDSTMTDDYTASKNGVWDRFMNNLAARLNVAQIVRNVRQDANITFDFTILVISAAVLASFGLVENSTIFLVSSMLISPLMGPIIAGIFGTVIKDGSLSKLGLVNELIGLLMATLVGFIFGLIVCSVELSYNIRDGGITEEMLSRTSLHSLLVGIITATVSGAAAAVGILGGNVGSLVGVAISASLLPPAVNAGVLWSLSCIFLVYTPAEDAKIHQQVGVYANDLPGEMAILGLFSMLLTFSNIFCVYVVGVVILKIKEVAPTVSDKFWRHDIKIARDYRKSIYGDPSLASEYAGLPKNDQNMIKCLNSLNIDDLSYQNTWSPGNLQSLSGHNQNLPDLEKYYATTIHSSRCGGGRANSICAEKIRSQLDDVSNYMRRASMPFEVLTRSPKQRRSVKMLPTIQASPEESSPSSTLEKQSRSKFTVTPALDSRKK